MGRARNELSVQVLTNGSRKQVYSGSVLMVDLGSVLKSTLVEIMKNKIDTSSK